MLKNSHNFTDPLVDVGVKLRNSRPPNPLVRVITVPTKAWRPKAKNKYKPIIYHDVDDDLYVLKVYGKAMT